MSMAYNERSSLRGYIYKHTPGPWKLGDNDDLSYLGGVIHVYGPESVAEISSQSLAIVRAVPPLEGSKQEYGEKWRMAEQRRNANARLIISAPDLLEACIQTVRAISGGPMTLIEARRLLCDAIAKAEGK